MSASRASPDLDVLLLHGAWCGAWVWDKVSSALTAAGLRVAAPQLPLGQTDARVRDYVSSAIGQAGASSVGLVVGHSLAGILLEPLALQCRVQSLMYLTAFVPQPGVSLREQWTAQPPLILPGWSRAVAADPSGVTSWTHINTAVDYLMNDCPPDAARATAAQLRPQAWTLTRDIHHTPLTTPSTVVTASRDRLLDSSELRHSAERIDVKRFAEIEADHMPMISHPRQLAELIQRALELRHTDQKRW
jgi:pimeloyl-ACP methyl ester carboxylesterase